VSSAVHSNPSPRTLENNRGQASWQGWLSRLYDSPLCSVLALAVVVIAYAPYLDTYFTTTDVWPLLATSRVAKPSELGDLFVRPIMAGSSFANLVGEHYRPLVSVSFALDYAVWGLNPIGYNLTNLGLHLANVLGLVVLARRLGLVRWAAALAALVFALHPVMASAVPAIARRQDSLAGLFLFPALVLVQDLRPGGFSRVTPRLAAGGGLFLVAVLSKEVALAAVPVAAILPLSRAIACGEAPAWPTVRRTVLPAVIVFGAAGLAAFAARLVVLRGLGGYFATARALREISTEAYGRVFNGFVGFLLWPVPDLNLFALLVGLIVGIGLTLSLPHWKRVEVVPLAVGTVWLGSFCLFYMVLKVLGESAWYMYLPLAGWGLALGSIIQACLPRVLRSAGDGGAVLLLVCAGTIVAATMWSSPLLIRYASWTDGGQIVERYAQGARGCFARVPEGTQLLLDDLPAAVSYVDRESHIAGATLLDDYSVQAMADLFAPEKRLTVKKNSGSIMREPSPNARTECTPGPDGWHLRLVGLR
jgi:hypothetical protein